MMSTTTDMANTGTTTEKARTESARPSLLRERPASLAVSLLSSVVFLASSIAMVPRIRAYYEGRSGLEQPRRYAFQVLQSPDFEFGGVPVVFEHVDGDTDSTDFVRVTYGEEELMLPDRVPGVVALPDLRRYEDWLKVVRFVETTGMSVADAQAKVDAGELTDRLALAVRIPPAGADTQRWGLVKRSEWRFETHELLPPDEDGATSIVSETWVAPESERAFNRRVLAAQRQGEPKPERREDELTQGTWQHDAAQLTMPDSRGYAPVFGADAFEAFGWTFPTAGLAAIVMPMGLAFLFAPRRTTSA